MDHHTVAAISITGTGLDVLGSLYLAYDLLGGQHGPLRLLTRAAQLCSCARGTERLLDPASVTFKGQPVPDY